MSFTSRTIGALSIAMLCALLGAGAGTAWAQAKAGAGKAGASKAAPSASAAKDAAPKGPAEKATGEKVGAKPTDSADGAKGKDEPKDAAKDAAKAKPGDAAKGKDAAKPKDDSAVDGATFVVKMRDLEQQIDELKEQIRRSHTRLSLLSDTILSGGVGGARAEIQFRNEMGGAFRVTKVLVVLDGAVQYSKQDETGQLAEQKQIPIFSGSVPPGDHTLQVLVQLRGHGFGVFSYLRGYKFEVKSSHSFTVTEGKTIVLNAIAFEKGGVTTPLEQRPAVRYGQTIQAGTGQPGGQAPSRGAAPGKASGSRRSEQ